MGWQDRRYDDFDEGQVPGWKRALRRIFVDGDNFFSWALPLFTLWGIRVRLHLFFIFYIVIQLISSISRGERGLIFVAIQMPILFLLVLIHEFGHCLACRRVGGEANEIVMWPLGGLAMCRPPRNWRASLITTLGGPATHLPIGIALAGALIALGAPTGVLLPNPLAVMKSLALYPDFFQGSDWWLKYAVWIAYISNATLFLFNMLLIMFPMDAGRVVQELLWRKIGYRRSMEIATTIGLVLAVFVGMSSMLITPPLTMLFSIAVFAGVTCFMERRKLSMIDTAGEEWKGASAGFDDEPGYATALKRQQMDSDTREKVRRVEREEAEQQQQEMDRILAKISQSGMASLSRKEQNFLQRESERKRGA